MGRSYQRSPELMKEDAERRSKKRKMGKPNDEGRKENGRMIGGQFYPKMLTGGQAKLDKNKNNKLDAQDFKILRAEKAKGRGMGLQDEKVKPGKVMKAKRGSGLDLPVIKSVKPEAKKNTTKTNPNKKRFSSMEEMRKAKGFKPGETPAEFNKRKAMLKRSVEAAKATRLGKIIAPIALTGVAAAQYLKSKMKKEESMRDRKKQPLKMKDKMEKRMGGGMMKKPMGYRLGAAIGAIGAGAGAISAAALRANKRIADKAKAKKRDSKKVEKKMGVGMMRRPMGYKQGMPVKGLSKGMSMKGDDLREIRKTESMIGASESSPRERTRGINKSPKRKMAGRQSKPGPSDSGMGPFLITRDKKVFVTPKKMGGGMMNKPMGYRSGKSVKVKCKLGRNKPTKMY